MYYKFFIDNYFHRVDDNFQQFQTTDLFQDCLSFPEPSFYQLSLYQPIVEVEHNGNDVYKIFSIGM